MHRTCRGRSIRLQDEFPRLHRESQTAIALISLAVLTSLDDKSSVEAVMSFLKKLFSGGGDGESAPAEAKAKRQVEHQGYVIKATPYKEGGQWQTCGVITKTVDGDVKEHRFIRADRFSDEDSAADHSILKGKQMVDQVGDRMFG
jgi:hypothetical protein